MFANDRNKVLYYHEMEADENRNIKRDGMLIGLCLLFVRFFFS